MSELNSVMLMTICGTQVAFATDSVERVIMTPNDDELTKPPMIGDGIGGFFMLEDKVATIVSPKQIFNITDGCDKKMPVVAMFTHKGNQVGLTLDSVDGISDDFVRHKNTLDKILFDHTLLDVDGNLVVLLDHNKVFDYICDKRLFLKKD